MSYTSPLVAAMDAPYPRPYPTIIDGKIVIVDPPDELSGFLSFHPTGSTSTRTTITVSSDDDGAQQVLLLSPAPKPKAKQRGGRGNAAISTDRNQRCRFRVRL